MGAEYDEINGPVQWRAPRAITINMTHGTNTRHVDLQIVQSEVWDLQYGQKRNIRKDLCHLEIYEALSQVAGWFGLKIEQGGG